VLGIKPSTRSRFSAGLGGPDRHQPPERTRRAGSARFSRRRRQRARDRREWCPRRRQRVGRQEDGEWCFGSEAQLNTGPACLRV